MSPSVIECTIKAAALPGVEFAGVVLVGWAVVGGAVEVDVVAGTNAVVVVASGRALCSAVVRVEKRRQSRP